MKESRSVEGFYKYGKWKSKQRLKEIVLKKLRKHFKNDMHLRSVTNLIKYQESLSKRIITHGTAPASIVRVAAAVTRIKLLTHCHCFKQRDQSPSEFSDYFI